MATYEVTLTNTASILVEANSEDEAIEAADAVISESTGERDFDYASGWEVSDLEAKEL